MRVSPRCERSHCPARVRPVNCVSIICNGRMVLRTTATATEASAVRGFALPITSSNPLWRSHQPPQNFSCALCDFDPINATEQFANALFTVGLNGIVFSCLSQCLYNRVVSYAGQLKNDPQNRQVDLHHLGAAAMLYGMEHGISASQVIEMLLPYSPRPPVTFESALHGAMVTFVWQARAVNDTINVWHLLADFFNFQSATRLLQYNVLHAIGHTALVLHLLDAKLLAVRPVVYMAHHGVPVTQQALDGALGTCAEARYVQHAFACGDAVLHAQALWSSKVPFAEPPPIGDASALSLLHACATSLFVLPCYYRRVMHGHLREALMAEGWAGECDAAPTEEAARACIFTATSAFGHVNLQALLDPSAPALDAAGAPAASRVYRFGNRTHTFPTLPQEESETAMLTRWCRLYMTPRDPEANRRRLLACANGIGFHLVGVGFIVRERIVVAGEALEGISMANRVCQQLSRGGSVPAVGIDAQFRARAVDVCLAACLDEATKMGSWEAYQLYDASLLLGWARPERPPLPSPPAPTDPLSAPPFDTGVKPPSALQAGAMLIVVVAIMVSARRPLWRLLRCSSCWRSARLTRPANATEIPHVVNAIGVARGRVMGTSAPARAADEKRPLAHEEDSAAPHAPSAPPSPPLPPSPSPLDNETLLGHQFSHAVRPTGFAIELLAVLNGCLIAVAVWNRNVHLDHSAALHDILAPTALALHAANRLMPIPRALSAFHFAWLLVLQFGILPAPCASLHCGLAIQVFLSHQQRSTRDAAEGSYAFARLFYRLFWLCVCVQKWNGRFLKMRVIEMLYVLPASVRVPPALTLVAEGLLAVGMFSVPGMRIVACAFHLHLAGWWVVKPDRVRPFMASEMVVWGNLVLACLASIIVTPDASLRRDVRKLMTRTHAVEVLLLLLIIVTCARTLVDVEHTTSNAGFCLWCANFNTATFHIPPRCDVNATAFGRNVFGTPCPSFGPLGPFSDCATAVDMSSLLCRLDRAFAITPAWCMFRPATTHPHARHVRAALAKHLRCNVTLAFRTRLPVIRLK